MSHNYVQDVGNLPVPKRYTWHWFMDMEFEPEPIGQDPLTGQNIYWGDGHFLLCDINDFEETEMPF